MIVRQTFNNMEIEVQAADMKELFKIMSPMQEVFSNDCCGKCKSNNVSLKHRVVDENDFYSINCNDCYAKLELGVHKKGGTLFAKKGAEDGKGWLPDNGWVKYDKKLGKLV